MRFNLPSVCRFLLLASVLMVAGLVTPWQAEAGESCRTKGETFARNSVARVFEKDAVRYACSYRRNRAHEIPVDDYTYGYFGPTRLSGYFVAHAGISTVDVRNLRTGRLRSVPGQRAFRAIDLELTDTGGFADLRDVGRDQEVPDRYIFEIRRVDSRGALILARGSDIDPESLVLRGSYIRWRQAGVMRRATLR